VPVLVTEAATGKLLAHGTLPLTASASAALAPPAAATLPVYAGSGDGAAAAAASGAAASAAASARAAAVVKRVRAVASALGVPASTAERVEAAAQLLAAGEATAAQVAALSYDCARPRIRVSIETGVLASQPSAADAAVDAAASAVGGLSVRGAEQRHRVWVDGYDAFDEVRPHIPTDDLLPPRLNFVVHNIDALAARAPEVMDLLALFSVLPQVHVVASADRPSAVWAGDERAGAGAVFRWWLEHAPTFEPYVKEIIHAPPVLAVSTKSRVKVQLEIVLTSLTANNRALLNILARAQCAAVQRHLASGAAGNAEADGGDKKRGRKQAAAPEAGFSGMTFSVWRDLAFDEGCVSNEEGFRRSARELVEQRLVVARIDQRTRVEVYSIPHKVDVIQREIINFTLGR
jgi:hypothetical protein